MWQLLLGLGAAQFFQHPGTTSLRGTPAQVLMPQGTAGQLVVVAPQQVTVPHHADSGSFQGAWMALCAAAPVAALAYYFASPSASPTPAPARTMPRSFAKRSMPPQMQMAGKKVAVPYAQALLELAVSEGSTKQTTNDMNIVSQFFTSSDDLSTFMRNPTMTPQAKKSVIKDVLGEQISQNTLNFLNLLVDKNRIAYLEDIAEKYQELAYEQDSIEIVKVTSAVELTADQQKQLAQKVKSAIGAKQIKLALKVDPSLWAGLQVEVADKIIDASLRSKYDQVMNTLDFDQITSGLFGEGGEEAGSAPAAEPQYTAAEQARVEEFKKLFAGDEEFGAEWDGKAPIFSEEEIADMKKDFAKPDTAKVLAELFPDASQADLAEAVALCDADDTEKAATLLVTRGAKAPVNLPVGA